MAQMKRSTRARGGGKLALFEVIQAAQTQGDGQLSEAVAPMVQAIAAREVPPEPEPAAAPAAPSTRAAAAPTRAQAAAPARPSAGRADPRSQRSGSGLLGLATAFAALVAIGSAGYIVFQHYARGPAPVVSGTAPMPQVLDVDGSTDQMLARPAESTQTQVRPQGAVSVPEGFRRTNGLNYVLVQSYHTSERAQAEATRSALLAAGIPATIEPGIPGWPNRLCVVGTDGFEQMKSNPAYQEYRRRLDEVSRKLTASDRKIKSFDPTAVQWGRG